MTLSPRDLVGTWRLESCEVLDDGVSVQRPFGSMPSGILAYTVEGFMLAAIMHGDRVHPETADPFAATAAEKAALVDGFLSYGGTYEIAGNRVRHRIDVSLFPNWVGTTQERIVLLEGDTLVLSTDPGTLGGSRVARLGWRRVRLSAPHPQAR